MREVKNTPEIKPINKLDNRVKSAEVVADKTNFEGKEIKDFSNPKAEALGRSQVKVSKTDNIENDLAVLMANPKKVENAEQFFDLALAKAEKEGHPEPFEQAALVTGLYAQEVLGLKA